MNAHTYLIWSLEHRAWWAPNSNGYTPDRANAGRYSLEEASQICDDANCWRKDQEPNEAMVPSGDDK